MTFKEKIEAHPFISILVACVSTGSILAVIIIWHYEIVLKNMDLVYQNKAIELLKSYVSKQDHELLLNKLKVQDEKPSNPILINPVRKTKVINNDSTDLYAIKIYKSEAVTEQAKAIRDKLKNIGYDNTEIFLATDNSFYVIVFGFACIGRGIKKTERELKTFFRKDECTVECINLTTYSSEGFIEYRKNTIFQYYIPRPFQASL